MFDNIDESLADSLLSPEERDEVLHIQKHFEEASEAQRPAFGWRVTTIYLQAFYREIERLRQKIDHVGAAHSLVDCACGHNEFAHLEQIVCTVCRQLDAASNVYDVEPKAKAH